MNNILIILPFLPYPLYTGGHQAVFNEINILRNHYNISIAYKSGNIDRSSIEKLYSIWPNVKIYPFELNSQKKGSKFILYERITDKIKRIIFKGSRELTIENELTPLYKYNRDDYNDFVRKIIEKESIDIVQCEFANQLDIVEIIPSNIKKVFIHHEIRFIRIAQFMLEQHLNGDYYKVLYNNLKQEEIGLLNKFDSVVTFSAIDTQKLQNNQVQSKLITSFCLVSSYNESYHFQPSTKTLTFVGPESHIPNKLGLLDFLDKSWKEILKKDKSIQLKIIGKWTQATIKNITSKYPQVEFLGFVNNLKESLQGTIMIVPITIGSGIRTKILEAAFMSVPIITTTVGVEGIPLENEKDCYIENNPTLFAQKTILLIQDTKKQQQFTMNAYNKVKELYSEEALLRTREKAYQ